MAAKPRSACASMRPLSALLSARRCSAQRLGPGGGLTTESRHAGCAAPKPGAARSLRLPSARPSEQARRQQNHRISSLQSLVWPFSSLPRTKAWLRRHSPFEAALGQMVKAALRTALGLRPDPGIRGLNAKWGALKLHPCWAGSRHQNGASNPGQSQSLMLTPLGWSTGLTHAFTGHCIRREIRVGQALLQDVLLRL